MLRTVLLGLLLACAASLGSSAVVLGNDGLPIMWARTPSQLSEFPKLNGIVTPNPWNYLHRMGLTRLLLAATDANMGFIGSSGSESPLWGLSVRLSWMLTSGRFVDPTGESQCGLQNEDPCISIQSWWGCMTYFFSVLPFLSAVQQGFMGTAVQVQMKLPEGEVFCTTYDECAAGFPDTMSKWDAFFQGVKALGGSRLPEGEKKDSLLGLYWAAEMASVASSSSACKSRQCRYSSTEVSFENNWINSIVYVAAAHFQLSLENSAMLAKNMPSRVLKVEDVAPQIADLSREENHALSLFSWTASMDTILHGSLARIWKSAMCSVTTREKGRELLGWLLLDPSFARVSLLSIIPQLASSC